MGHRVTCNLYAEYHQFYLLDEGVSPKIPTDFAREDLIPRLVVRPHLVMVLTFQPNRVGIAVEVRDDEPPLDTSAWDHVAECSAELPTGRLAVDRCVGGVAARLAVPPGWYRVRVCLGGIRRWRDVPEGEDPPESYEVAVWQGRPGPLEVRKQWGGPLSV
jgi:hypothetical protein